MCLLIINCNQDAAPIWHTFFTAMFFRNHISRSAKMCGVGWLGGLLLRVWQMHLSPVKCSGAAIRRQRRWHRCIKQLSTPMIISTIACSGAVNRMPGWLQRQVSGGWGAVGGVEAGEMSLNNIKSPPSSETGSKLLHAQTNRQIDLSEHLSALIKSYSTQPPHFQDHTTALRLGLWWVGGWWRGGVCVSMCVWKNVMHNFLFLVPKFSVFL